MSSFSIGVYYYSGRTIGREFDTLAEARDFARYELRAPNALYAEIYDVRDELLETVEPKK